jgi:hypothetical protein
VEHHRLSSREIDRMALVARKKSICEERRHVVEVNTMQTRGRIRAGAIARSAAGQCRNFV